MILKPEDKGLYEVRREHDSCGIGAVVNVSGEQSHSIIEYGKEILVNLHHRGAAGADEVTGDAAAEDAAASLKAGIDRLIDDAEKAITDGASLIIISDRDVSQSQAPIPSLLAIAVFALKLD
jgi:glutamate synthase domain-containing protein 1